MGLDRTAAKNALSAFTQGTTLRASQVQFLDEIVNHLTEHGALDPSRLYESPYTDFSPQGVDGLFDSGQVDQLISTLDQSANVPLPKPGGSILDFDFQIWGKREVKKRSS